MTGIRIDELPPETLPTLDHGVAAMKDGQTVFYLLSQVADLILQIIRDGAPAGLDTLAELATYAEGINTAVEGHETRLDALEPEVAGKQNADAMLTALAALTSSDGKFLAFSGADSPVVRSILGTVSQSSGTPTGALFESGSNSNGLYLRFADGTQICWFESGSTATTSTAASNIWSSGNLSYTFPAAFAAAPKVAPYARYSSSSSPWATHGTGGVTTTTVSLLLLGATNSATGYPGYIAVGKWY